MAGIIAHTVGVIAAAGGGDPLTQDDFIVTVGSAVTDRYGYSEPPPDSAYGAISSENWNGYDISRIFATDNSGSAALHSFIFEVRDSGGTLSIGDISRIEVETSGATAILNSADATFTYSGDYSRWAWFENDPGWPGTDSIWDAGDVGVDRTVSVFY